jgi:uncharacterized protein (TIGR02647 family)
MALNNELIAEIRLLSLFKLDSIQEGVKVHGNADPEMIAAAQRLFDKHIITQHDGGYLTDLGIELAEHVQKALIILQAH